MFLVCTPEQSEALLEDLADIEKEMFTELGLHFKILVNPFLGSFIPWIRSRLPDQNLVTVSV